MGTVAFPGLGLEFHLNRVAFHIGSWPVYWYGIIIAAGFLLAVLFCRCLSHGDDGHILCPGSRFRFCFQLHGLVPVHAAAAGKKSRPQDTHQKQAEEFPPFYTFFHRMVPPPNI